MVQSVFEIAVDKIRENRKQPRTTFDEQSLDELASSIREHGLLQPLIVTEHAADEYELIAGERRWRAAQRAGLTHVPVLVKQATPQQLLELALVENIQRADLNPIEEGRAYQTLKDEFGLTDEDIARRVGKSRVAVANARRLTRLIVEAQQALIDGVISAGHGRALLRLEQPEQQAAALMLVQRHDLSVRDIERVTDLIQHEHLSAPVSQALIEGTVSASQARSLLQVIHHPDQVLLFEAVVAHDLDEAATEQVCRLVADGVALDQALALLTTPISNSRSLPSGSVNQHMPGGAPAEQVEPVQSTSGLSSEDAASQRMFEAVLGTPVHLMRNGKTIRLTITLYSDEQLQGLYDLLASVV